MSSKNLSDVGRTLLRRGVRYPRSQPIKFAFLSLYIGFAIIYLIVFQITRLEPLSESIKGALINTLPLIALSALVIWALNRVVFGRAIWRHFAVHAVLATAFTFGWYLIVLVGRGFDGNWLEEGFEIRPFGWIGGVWQLYQGIALYVIAAVFAYAAHFYGRMKRAEALSVASEVKFAPPSNNSDQLIIKSGGEYHTLDYAEIVWIEADGDEVRLHSKTRTIGTTKSLASLSEVLPVPPFVRIHRSYLVNINCVLSAESAGNGKLTIHLKNGHSLTTSRSGAQAFRVCVD